MSKKVVSLAAIWLLLSMLVQAAGQPPISPTSTAAPAASKWNVELVGRWPLSTERPTKCTICLCMRTMPTWAIGFKTRPQGS